jgi:hypothetical protein
LAANVLHPDAETPFVMIYSINGDDVGVADAGQRTGFVKA